MEGLINTVREGSTELAACPIPTHHSSELVPVRGLLAGVLRRRIDISETGSIGSLKQSFQTTFNSQVTAHR